MEFERIYKKSIQLLEKESCEYAVCGGVAAMLYRHEPRFTADIDFLISGPHSLVDFATDTIEAFGLKANVLRMSELTNSPMMHKKTSPIAVVVGRSERDKNATGLDFLMPVQGWSKNALTRAKDNIISLHNVSAPFLTAEDVLLAKFSALTGVGKRREKDWSDVVSIVQSGRELDLGYLGGEIDHLKLSIPMELERELPKAVAVALKRNRTQSRRRSG